MWWEERNAKVATRLRSIEHFRKHDGGRNEATEGREREKERFISRHKEEVLLLPLPANKRDRDEPRQNRLSVGRAVLQPN